MKKTLIASLLFLLSTSAFALVDESRSLREVLEFGSLSKKDCELYAKGDHSETTTLRCGKWMFFYDDMGRPGLPKGIVDLIRKNAPNTMGANFEKIGLIADPFDTKAAAIGLPAGAKMKPKVETYAITCATCHFAALPDGRYKVGHPNSKFDFSKLMLATTLLPSLALQPKKVIPADVALKMQSTIDEFYSAKWGRLETAIKVIGLIPSAIALGQVPPTDPEMSLLAAIPPGVLDPMSPGGADDHYDIPLRILPIWGLSDPEAMTVAGSQNGAMLTSSGGTQSLDQIYHTGARITDIAMKLELSKSYNPTLYVPLTRYLNSLKAPKNLKTFDSATVQEGARVFKESCASCHNGPAFAGTSIYSFEEIGTDAALALMYAPDEAGDSLVVEQEEITRGVRASRLEGWWSLQKLLHNGSVSSFEQLLCLEKRVENSARPSLDSKGHTYACDSSEREKRALVEFLESI